MSKVSIEEWQKEHQVFEKNWHNSCLNSWQEETKQQVYAKRMGLVPDMVLGKYPVYDLKNIKVCDIGGGPYSLLLKCVNFSGIVVDPCDYPQWTVDRYKAGNIQVIKKPAEDVSVECDEAWIYNVLQHTISPEKIIKNALKSSKVIRVFEWVDNGISVGHPHNLTEENLNKWLGGVGKTEQMNESGCHGKAFYGVFLGDRR